MAITTKTQIKVPYIGDALSVNRQRYDPRYGCTRLYPRAKAWRNDLAAKVRAAELAKSNRYRVSVAGRFRDERRPDISNLFKIISDAVQDGLGVNDKFFRLIDEGYMTGYVDPHLIITIEVEDAKEPVSVLQGGNTMTPEQFDKILRTATTRSAEYMEKHREEVQAEDLHITREVLNFRFVV